MVRLDIVAENPIESIALRSGALPINVVKAVWSFTVSRTLEAAVELDVFALFLEGPRTARQLAEAQGWDERGIETLLAALNSFGLLKRRDGVFELTKEARKFFTGGPDDNKAGVRLGAMLGRKMENLADAIRTGERPDFHESLDDEEWAAYLEGLAGLAPMTAKEVVRKLKLKDEARLLDVGGGHARFSIALCEAREGLKAEILDLPGAGPVGRKIIAESRVADRVEFREGDLRTTPWGEGYDLVLLFNILHNLEESVAAESVQKAFDALAPGGRLAILEGQHAGGSGNLSFQEGFGELLFYVLSNSLTWPWQTLQGWMEAAGFVNIKRKKMLTLPGAVFLVGER
jgi:SAM-dependent methyltransferase